MERYFKYGNSEIHCLVFGSGSEPLITFHGFGQNGSMFLELEESLEKRFKVYSLDFAYHGKTIWREKEHFSKSHLLEIIDSIMKESGTDKISLMGFSMGGKVVLSLTESIPEKINYLFLLAPDGVKERAYYKPLLANDLGTTIFRTMMSHPNILINYIKAVSKLGWVKPYVRDYVVSYMGSDLKREKMFRIWMTLRTFPVRLSKIRSAVEKNAIKVKLFWGKYDKMIPYENGIQFKRKIPSCNFETIEGGHFIVKKSLNPVVEKLLDDSVA